MDEHLISPSWVTDSLKDIRDLLQSEGRQHLAAALSEIIGALAYGLAPDPAAVIPWSSSKADIASSLRTDPLFFADADREDFDAQA